MKKYLKKIREDYKDMYIYSSSYIREDALDIRKSIRMKMAAVNCKRIFLLMPIFLGLDLHVIFALKQYANDVKYRIAIEQMKLVTPDILQLLAQVLLLLLVGYAIVIFNWIYVREDSPKEEIEYRRVYRSFWWIWSASMLVISFGYLAITYKWWLYIVVCLIMCLIPLSSRLDFFANIAGVLLAMLVLVYLVGEFTSDMRLITYSLILMLSLGYVVQIFEVETWTLREYIYVNTFIDPLTMHLNRRGGNALMKKELSKTEEKTTLGVIMMDVDFFKKYNDLLGHDQGDQCLKHVATNIRAAVEGRTKIMVRHGGEEFVVILVDATEEETREWAEKIRATIFASGLSAPHKEVADVVTVSVGATLFETNGFVEYEKVLHTADEALYEAKQTGRNRVVFLK